MKLNPGDSPAVLVDIAIDYLLAALSGEPVYAETVADNYGAHRVSRGMATLLIHLAIDTAHRTDNSPEEILETMRITYGTHEAAS